MVLVPKFRLRGLPKSEVSGQYIAGYQGRTYLSLCCGKLLTWTQAGDPKRANKPKPKKFLKIRTLNAIELSKTFIASYLSVKQLVLAEPWSRPHVALLWEITDLSPLRLVSCKIITEKQQYTHPLRRSFMQFLIRECVTRSGTIGR